MSVLTNDYLDFELLNLGSHANGRGPYIIRQVGISPGSLTDDSHPFLLRKDGTWVIAYQVWILSEYDQERDFLFHTIQEVEERVLGLTGNVTADDRIPENLTPAEILAATARTERQLLQAIHHAADVRRERLNFSR